MKKVAASAAHLPVLLFITLLAVSSAEYRPRPAPPGSHMRGPPPHQASHQPSPHKGYSSSSKLHHQHHHFHQNSYPGPSFNKGTSPYNRPMRYRKPSPTTRPTSWEGSSYKLSNKDRYKPHYSSGEPPAGVNVGTSSFSTGISPNVSPLSGFESFSAGMDHLTDLSPIRTIPAPNLGPTATWASTAHLGMGTLAGQLAAQSAGIFSPHVQHHGLDVSDANAALLAASKQHAHGYQVTEPSHLYAQDPDTGRTTALIRPVVDPNLQNDLPLRLSPFAAMSHQLVGQPSFSAAASAMPVSSLTTQDLYQFLNSYPLQQDTHSYVRPGQSAVSDAAQLQSQLHQAQLQQAQLHQAQLQQAQLQQLAALNAGTDTRATVPLRLGYDDQQQQILGLPSRRGQHQELEGADSSQVLRLYHNVPVNIGSHGIHRQPGHHNEESMGASDSEVEGSEHSTVAHPHPVSPSPSPAPEESQEYADEPTLLGNMAEASETHFGDSSSADSAAEDDDEDSRPIRIRTRKNRDRGTS